MMTTYYSLVVIDSRVEEFHTLLAYLPCNSRTMIIEASEDGLTQIQNFVCQVIHENPDFVVSALHLICHGEPGILHLGNTVLDIAELSKRAATLESIGASLRGSNYVPEPNSWMVPGNSGEIFIYGCRAAEGIKGREFVEKLGVLTGSSIAASTTPTGNANLGGDWVLDLVVGEMASKSIALPNYPHVLALVEGNGSGNPLSGSGGSDAILGYGGNDSITGGAGDDFLDGGSGFDQASFSGVFANYSFSQEIEAFAPLVITGPDGVDVVENIERLVFSDATVQIDKTPVYDFRVNDESISGATQPALTALPNGGWVVFWYSSVAIYGQRYGADGKETGSEFQVNTTNSSAYSLSVSTLGDGGWVVVWEASTGGLYGQRFDPAASKVGSEFRINEGASFRQEVPVVSALDNGGWVVVWDSIDSSGNSKGVLGQRYDDNGNAVGVTFQVDSQPAAKDEADPAVTGLADGGWLVVWQNYGNNQNNDIYAQRYDADGDKVGAEFLVNSTTADEQRWASVQGLPGGGWIIAWETDVLPGDDSYDIHAQRYSSGGARVGDEFQVNASSQYRQGSTNIALLEDGGWLITWSNFDSSSITADVYKVSGQRFDSDGVPVGGEFTIDQSGGGSVAPSGLADGGWVVVWPGTKNDSGYIVGKRYDESGDAVSSGATYDLVITGDSSSQTLKGWGRGEPIYGMGGDDILNTGEDISPYLGEYSNQLFGGAGDDQLVGYLFSENLFDGGDGHDILIASTWLTSNYYVITPNSTGYTIAIPNVLSFMHTSYLVDVEEIVFSDKTVSLANGAPQGLPVIKGNLKNGELLTVDTSGITDPDGLGIFSYQWLRDGSIIPGPVSSSYSLVQSDVGHSISVRVAYKDGGLRIESVTSAGTANIADVGGQVSGTVTISGIPQEGNTLAVETSGIPTNDSSVTFRWFRDGEEIDNAFDDKTYVLVQDDVGSVIKAKVTYKVDGGGTNTIESLATAPVENVNDPATGDVEVIIDTGNQSILHADTDSLSDEDGLGALNFQWRRAGVDINGATSSSYTLQTEDVGKLITVKVSYTDGAGTYEQVFSQQGIVPGSTNNSPTGNAIVNGDLLQGAELIADVSSVSDVDGLGTFSYQWLRGGINISGASSSSYLLTQDDVGKKIQLLVSYTDGTGTQESILSAESAVVANTNDLPDGAVLIVGKAVVGNTLSVDASALTDLDGLGSFSYLWLRDGSVIGGATSSSYLLTEGDVGHSIAVKVSYLDQGFGSGTAESITSTGTSPVLQDVSESSSLVVSGLAVPGELLTVETQGVIDPDGLGPFSYQWLRDGQTISGATSSSYTVLNGDINKAISVKVSYVDGEGNNEAIFSAARFPVPDNTPEYIDLIEMYVVIPGRAPDASGLSFWSGIIDDGGTFEFIASEMWNSPPTRALYPAFMTMEETVTAIYDNVLNREPDEEGLDYWTDRWEANGPVETMLEMIDAIKTYSGTNPDALVAKQLFLNKVDVGAYLAISLESDDLDLAADAFNYLEDGNSLQDTFDYIDEQMDVLGQSSIAADEGLS